MEEESQKTPKHSSGVNILIRIDALWKDTHLHSRGGQFSSWNSDLDRIWLELARDIKNSEFVNKESIFKGFDSDLIKEGNIQDGASGKGFATKTKTDLEKRDNQYKILMKKQIFLARLENELGKGTTKKSEEDDME